MTKYISARQVWHDAYTLSDRTPGSGKLTGPNAKRIDFFTQKAATTITASATIPRGAGRGVWVAEEFELVHAHRIIREMKPLLRAWGMFAYTYQWSESQHSLVRSAVFRWYTNKRGAEFHSDFARTFQVMQLINCVIEDMKHRYSSKKRLHTPTTFSFHMQVHKQNWERDWEARRLQVEEFVDDLDKRALAPIAKMLNERVEEMEA